MKYYYAKTIEKSDIDDVEELVTASLKKAGFGVLTKIDVQSTLKEKINAEFRPYRILGACNPELAHRALQAEDKIGTMLPCNVILQKVTDGVEVAAVDPAASMQAVKNDALSSIAADVRDRLQAVIESL